MSAIDLVSAITEDKLPSLKAAGITDVIRYLSSHPKGITKPEYELLLDNGFGVILVYESQGDQYEYFTTQQGEDDAATIAALLDRLGAPAGCAIYICADDFDANDEQIAGGIHDYFTALKPLLPLNRIGGYGNGAALAHLLDAGLISLAWIWGAGATNGTQDFIASNRWVIRQRPTINEFGLSVDPDDVQGDYGAIRREAAPVETPVVEQPPTPPVEPPPMPPEPVSAPAPYAISLGDIASVQITLVDGRTIAVEIKPVGA